MTQAGIGIAKLIAIALAYMKTNARHHAHAFRRFAGWCVLALYVGVFSPVGLSLMTALGSLDLDHQVNLQTGDRGVRVVLHHQQASAAHHHGLLARTLNLFAQPASSAEPDHVLQFGAADSVSGPRQLKAPPLSASALTPVAPASPLVCPLARSLAPFPPSHAKPDQPSGWSGVRSIVLLI